MYVFRSVHMCMCTPLVSVDYFIYCGRVSQLKPELINLTSVTIQLVLGILSLFPACWDYRWAIMPVQHFIQVLGIRSLVLRLSSLSTELTPQSLKGDLKQEKVL